MAKPETTRVEVKEEKDEPQGELKSRYSSLESIRFSHLMRSRECATLTIPTLLPPQGHSNVTKFATPYQGIGARGVNNLASKLLLALMPPNSPFFRLDVSQAILAQFGSTRGDVESALGTIEQDVMKELASSNARLALFEGLKQLVVSGNVLLQLPEKTNSIRVFRMDRYVVNRDVMGDILQIVIKEDISPSMLAPDIALACAVSEEESSGTEKSIELYTGVEWDEDTQMYEVEQEINGIQVPGSFGTYPKDKLPFLALRLIAVDNEDYGRSYVEEYLGDLKSLEGLTKAIVEGSAASAKMIWLVNPNGTTKQKTIAESANNAVVPGHAPDVTVLQANKYADFRVALETIKDITDRLGYAFMLNTSVQRNGERVTAEEIKYMGHELEDGLGGIYTVLTQELQLPLLIIIMERLKKAKKIPSLPKGIVQPVIITGLEAIGRTQDLQKLQMFVQAMTQLNYQNRLVESEVINRVATALAVDTQGLVKTDAQIQAEQAQQQQAAMAQAAAPNAVNQAGQLAQTAMQQMQAPDAHTPSGT